MTFLALFSLLLYKFWKVINYKLANNIYMYIYLHVMFCFVVRICFNDVFLLQFGALMCVYIYIYIYIWFLCFNFFFLFLVHKGDWGILFWKILAKCHSKKDRNLFCFTWNYSKPSWWSSIISSLCFASSFILVYFDLNFVNFCLLIILFESISL